MLTLTDVGVRVVEMKQRRRRENVPTVLGQQVKERTWPVRHLNFQLEAGEAVFVLDIANHRPALFLRLVTGLLAPDEGTVTLPRRSLLSVAPSRKQLKYLSVEQSLRFIAGCCGLSDRAIDRKFDDMVEFAGVSRLLHRQSQSQPRHVLAQIGFAVATTAPVDLLAFDRTAIVGDKEFRAKCVQRLNELKTAGKGLVIYSQDVRQVRAVADRGLVLDGDKSAEFDPDMFARMVIDDKQGRWQQKRKRRRRGDSKER